MKSVIVLFLLWRALGERLHAYAPYTEGNVDVWSGAVYRNLLFYNVVVLES